MISKFNLVKCLGALSMVSLAFGLAACSDDGVSPVVSDPTGDTTENAENPLPASSSSNTAISSSSHSTISSSSIATIPGSSSTPAVTPEISKPEISNPEQPFESPSNGNIPEITYAATGASVQNNNGCVTVTGGEVLITCAGDYDFSGSYSGADAQIRVYSPKADSGVYLNLRGLTLKNSADAPIYVQMASKSFVVAESETVNTLSDGSTRTKAHTYVNNSGVTKTDTTNAAIYSKDD
ncbi:MAG: carbohydrate-binding domain-containing protein, partial [Fibrobacter sp.]|nr:carbohydrate-binding domain-containing protein [Fibrobacter sp.]